MRTATAANMSAPVEVPQPIPRAACDQRRHRRLGDDVGDEGVRLQPLTSTGYGSPARMPIGVAWATMSNAGRVVGAARRPGRRIASAAARSGASRRAGSASCRASSAAPASSRARAIARPGPAGADLQHPATRRVAAGARMAAT